MRLDLAGIPPWGRWAVAYAGTLALSSTLGGLTPIGAGNAVFLAGAVAILASLSYVRFGGPKTRAGRDLQGRPLWTVDPELRRQELRKGLALFALGLALWAPLLLTLQ